jgi:transcriptional regulator with XRE-family HTH domain
MADQARIDAQRVFAQRVGENLARARKAAGLSQEALSFEASLHRTEIGMLERGIRIPRIDTALKLAHTLGISIDDLVAGIEWRAAVLTGGRWSAAPRNEGSSTA